MSRKINKNEPWHDFGSISAVSIRLFGYKQVLYSVCSIILALLITVNQSVGRDRKEKTKSEKQAGKRTKSAEKEPAKRQRVNKRPRSKQDARLADHSRSKAKQKVKDKRKNNESSTSRTKNRRADRREQHSKSEKNTVRSRVKTESVPEPPKAEVQAPVSKLPDLPVAASSQQIVASLNSGSGEAIKGTLDDGGIELKILGNSGRYAPNEAAKVLDLFFSQYKPQSTAVLHKGKTKSGLTYMMGKMTCTNLKDGNKPSEVDLYVVYKVNGNTISIRNLELN